MNNKVFVEQFSFPPKNQNFSNNGLNRHNHYFLEAPLAIVCLSLLNGFVLVMWANVYFFHRFDKQTPSSTSTNSRAQQLPSNYRHYLPLQSSTVIKLLSTSDF
jgi:hypothetical protein